jgi:ketosteroid isomerase-like protein
MGGFGVTTDDTRAALDDLIDAFQCADHDRLVSRYDDDIDWVLYAPILVFPFAGKRRGKTEVLTSLLGVYQHYQITKYDVQRILVDGDQAATVSDINVIQRATGRIINSQLAGFHRFRDGKLFHYRGYTDSFDTAEQALGYEIDI